MTGKEAITKLNILSSYDTEKEKREEYKECIYALIEELDEKDKLFAKLYLATEENKTLLRENRKLERKIKMLEDK